MTLDAPKIDTTFEGGKFGTLNEEKEVCLVMGDALFVMYSRLTEWASLALSAMLMPFF